MPWRDRDDDDFDAPQEMDLWGDEDDDQTQPCPVCGRQIHEDAPKCPYCGVWVDDVTPAQARSRGWFWPVLVAIIIATILVYWHGLGR